MAAPKSHAGTVAIITALIGPSIPGGYMAITGHTPTWARAWYLAWAVLGLLVIIAKAGKADS